MNLLFLNWRDTTHPKAGGAEKLTENIVAELVQRGHTITLLCPAFSNCQREENKPGYRVIRRGNQFTVRLHAWRLWQQEFSLHSDSFCVDQVHGLPFFTPFYVKHKRSLTFIHEVAGDLWQRNFIFPVSLVGKFLEILFLRLYRHRRFVTVCQSTKDDLVAAGISAQNIAIMPVYINFKPLPAPSFNKSLPIIVHLGRIAPVKNIEDTISACLRLRQKIPDLRLWLVGSGQGHYFNHITKLASRHDNFITMHGYVSEERKRQLLEQAKVLVAASHKEGYGLNVLEAAACGTPVVAYNVNGLREAVIDGQTGLLTNQNTPENLASQLRKILSDNSLHQKLGRAAWERSHNFSPQKTTDAFEKILHLVSLKS